MFQSLNIDPPKAERFICNLVLVIWNFLTLQTALINYMRQVV